MSADHPDPSARAERTPRTAGEMLAMARAFLARKGVPEARLDAELVVARALGLGRLGLYLDLERPVREDEIASAREMLVRRGRREPLAYVTGEREFYGRAFRVAPGVLVPRPETELLVDRARAALAARDAATPARVLDFGTGSGCIAVTIALERAPVEVVAIDGSERALAIARENAARLGATVRFVAGDGPESARAHAPFALVVSNPPYVDPERASELAPELREHEPPEALFHPRGDPDHWVRRLVAAARELLEPGGVLLVELGEGQGARALELARERGFGASLHKDLARIDRVLEARA